MLCVSVAPMICSHVAHSCTYSVLCVCTSAFVHGIYVFIGCGRGLRLLYTHTSSLMPPSSWSARASGHTPVPPLGWGAELSGAALVHGFGLVWRDVALPALHWSTRPVLRQSGHEYDERRSSGGISGGRAEEFNNGSTVV